MSTELQTIDVSGMQNIFLQAPAILETNVSSKEKAFAAGLALLENADKVGMSDKLDEQMSMFVGRAKKTVEAMNERRKPFTQLITAVQKQFTGLEKEVSDVVKQVQDRRDAYATEKIEAQRERERIEQARLEKERNAIQMRKDIETKISNSFIADLTTAKRLLFDKFNATTVEGVDGVHQEIESFSEDYSYTPPVLDEKQTFRLSGSTFTGREINATTAETVDKLLDDFKENYKTEISALKRELIDKLPSKVNELQELAKADAENRARLEREAAEREAAESERLERERREAADRAAAEAELRATAETVNAIAESEISLETKPEVKEGYEIEVKKTGGWLLITQFWYEREGKTLDNAKIAKYTFERMKRFCEAYALKNEEKIVSPLIEYKPIYKAK
jgi:TolA-binding protein